MLIIHVDDSQGEETLQFLECVVAMVITILLGKRKKSCPLKSHQRQSSEESYFRECWFSGCCVFAYVGVCVYPFTHIDCPVFMGRKICGMGNYPHHF